MTKCKGMTAAIRLLLMVSCVLSAALGSAQAQDAREAVLILQVGPDLVPPVALQGALEAELGVGVELRDQPDFTAPTLTVARVPSGNVEVALSSRSLPRSTRQLVLSNEIESERVETLALIAANLVRNEAAALLPDLRPAKVASVDVATPAPRPEPAPAKPADDPCALQPRGGFGFDFAPGVGASSDPSQRRAPRRVSLGIIGALHGPLHGLALSIGVNIARGPVCGAQLAIANIAIGPVTGAQLGELNFARGDLHGAQLGLLNLGTAGAHGLQAGLANGAGGKVHGAQLGLVNYAGGKTEGLAAGLLNIGIDHVQGAQMGLANVATGGIHGAQLGLANISAGDVKGAQIGVGNVSTGATTTQIGVFNYADSSKLSLGVLSIVRRGRTSIDITGTVESALLLASVTHGGKYWHNTYGIGSRIDKQGERLAVQLGFGVRAFSRGRVRVDIDALSTHLLRDGTEDSYVAGGRVPVTVLLARGFGVMIAPGYSVMITDDTEENPDPLFGRSAFKKGTATDDTRVYGYPSLTLGLRYELDHGT
ncbi:MAG: hypothetical protein ABW252_20015 [Polyangiales bacterium]